MAQQYLRRLASDINSWMHVVQRRVRESSAAMTTVHPAPLLHPLRHRPPHHSSPPHRMCTRFHRLHRFCRLLSLKQGQRQKLTPVA